jgi:pimeloyl-ACP methyl ester carboxylesterase
MALLLNCPATAFNMPLHARQADTTFDWTALTPTADLQYQPCYTKFQCARLQVPLDWSKTNGTTPPANFNGPFAAIALVTLPATVSRSDPAYAGPILINPGGPSGSGTEMALALAATFQSVLDIPGERHYEIIGFDPRGVGLTTPSASCYKDQYFRAVDTLRTAGVPSVLTEQGLRMRFEWGIGYGQLCEQAQPGEDSVFRHMSTASVARDMLEIVERSHQLMVEQKNGTATACGGGNGEKPRLQYMGFSYGSILGNTFASMFPGRVGRMVLDGIADAADYMAGVSLGAGPPDKFEHDGPDKTRPGPRTSLIPRPQLTSSTEPVSMPARPARSVRPTTRAAPTSAPA